MAATYPTKSIQYPIQPNPTNSNNHCGLSHFRVINSTLFCKDWCHHGPQYQTVATEYRQSGMFDIPCKMSHSGQHKCRGEPFFKWPHVHTNWLGHGSQSNQVVCVRFPNIGALTAVWRYSPWGRYAAEFWNDLKPLGLHHFDIRAVKMDIVASRSHKFY